MVKLYELTDDETLTESEIVQARTEGKISRSLKETLMEMAPIQVRDDPNISPVESVQYPGVGDVTIYLGGGGTRTFESLPEAYDRFQAGKIGEGTFEKVRENFQSLADSKKEGEKQTTTSDPEPDPPGQLTPPVEEPPDDGPRMYEPDGGDDNAGMERQEMALLGLIAVAGYMLLGG